MPLVAASAPETSATADAFAVRTLRNVFALQKSAFTAAPNPSAGWRRERLHAVVAMMHKHRSRIAEALATDFGSHARGASDLIETLGPVGRAEWALANLEAWMAPERRHVDPGLFGDVEASVRHSPKGVIGNIVPWNFPFDIAVGPLVDMLAAGNRVIIKPSDYTPASGELLAEMVAATFNPDTVFVSVGGLELARAFAGLPWDHLLYTGSQNVGREVALAAAANLTPVTLELGGKCPAVLTPGAVNARNVEAVVGTKLVKNGQMCISVDYCLVHEAELESFLSGVEAHVRSQLPEYSRTDDCTGIISERHLHRLRGMLEEARVAGCRILEPEAGGKIDFERRRMPLALVVDPPADLKIMTEEVFGPILTVLTYADLDQAVERVNAGERPLGVYVFADDLELAEQILARTVSGGGVINHCALQGAVPALGFGGVGASGSGRHHGYDGFREFSNPRGVVVRGADDRTAAFAPPYARAEALLAEPAAS